MKLLETGLLIFSLSLLLSCTREKKAEYLLRHFIKTHEQELATLHRENSEAYWDIYTSGLSVSGYFNTTDSLHRLFIDKTEVELSLRALYTNISEYDFLSKMKASNLIKDPLLLRQLNKLFNQYAWARLDIYSLSDKQCQLTKNFIELVESKPSKQEIQFLGTDSMLIYDKRKNDLIHDFKASVHEKNKAAKKAGFDDFWDYWLNKNEITDTEQEKVIYAIEKATHDDYILLKGIIDSMILTKSDINKQEITYSDFYYNIYSLGNSERWGKAYNGDTIKQILVRHLVDKGFNASEIFKSSQIFWDSDHMSGSFVVNMDNYHDVRIYSNMKPTQVGITNLLHEMGHALYFSSVDDDIPFMLREPNLAMNEAFGFVMQSLVLTDSDLRRRLKIDDPKVSGLNKIKSPHMLFMTRDLLVRAELEKEIFKNPDQDINALFWNLKKKYFYYDQPDDEKVALWIQDSHIINNSGIYQAYLYATAISGMLLERVKTDEAYGSWFTENIFKYGDSRYWREILESGTGYHFTTKYVSNLYK